jgi:CheY-like chemotaxis protein
MRRIWIVDDDDDMNQAIGLMLKMLDCEVMAFRSARSTVQSLLTGKRPDLLILDINMPEVSGIDLLEFLRRRNEWKDLPIIMLSSDASDSTIEKAIRIGADAYVIKPVTIEELERAIATAMQKHVSIE